MEAANILIFTHISPRVHHPYGTVDDAEISVLENHGRVYLSTC